MAKVKFDEIAKECRSTFKGDKTGVAIVGLEHIVPNEMLVKDYEVDTENTFSKSFKKGQILFGRRRAYQQKAGVATFDGICSGDITVIEAISGKVDKDLLPFIIQNERFFEHAVQGSAGSLSPRVKWEHLASYEFDLPSLPEQKILADKLWAAYRLKESYKKLLAATDEMVKSQFIEMFGDQNLNDKGWVSSLIKDEFALNMGKTPARAESSYWTDNGNKWISIADMANYSKFTGETAEQITDKAIKECGIKPVEPNTVIMSFKLSIGRTAITSEKVYTNEAIMAFSNYDPNKFALEFVYYAFSQKNWLMGAKQAVKGATLNKESIGKSSIIIPPLNLQKEFVAILKQADKSKSVHYIFN